MSQTLCLSHLHGAVHVGAGWVCSAPQSLAPPRCSAGFKPPCLKGSHYMPTVSGKCHSAQPDYKGPLAPHSAAWAGTGWFVPLLHLLHLPGTWLGFKPHCLKGSRSAHPSSRKMPLHPSDRGPLAPPTVLSWCKRGRLSHSTVSCASLVLGWDSNHQS